MNRSKKIYALLGVLILVCAATFAVKRIEEHKEKIRNSDEIILELPGDSVRSLSWEYGETALAFHKSERWLYDEDEAFPVSEKQVGELLEQFESFGVSFTIEDVEDYSQYGLDDPICTIRLTTDQQSYEIKLGDYSKMDSKRYVSIGDGSVYLVQNDPLEHFDVELRDMIDNDETPSFDKVTGIQFKGDENYTIAYEEDSTSTYSADDVYFARQSGQSQPLDTSSVDSYLQTISYLSLTDYISYNATEEELLTYGLDTPDLTVMVDYIAEDGDGSEGQDTFVLHISRDPEEKKAEQEAVENGDEDSTNETVTAYARVGDSQIIYKISSSSYKNLMAASYDDLRHREVFWGDFADVRQIDISLEGAKYIIDSEKEGDERTYIYQGEELEIDDLKKALESLSALSANSFTDERPTQREEIQLTVYLDNENYPQISISLYRYDGTDCLAVVNGQPVSFVERTAVVDLIEAVHMIVLN